MSTTMNRWAVPTALVACRFSGCAVASIGVLVLLGWALDSTHLKSVVPGLVAMNPVSAVCFILAASALVLLSPAEPIPLARRFGNGLAIVIAGIAAVKLLGAATGMEAGIDQLLFRGDLARGAGPPNRMAPNTALNFLLLGAALFTLRNPSSWPSATHVFAIVAAFVSYLALMGYAFVVGSLTRVSTFIPMALHTACCFLVLSAGVLMASHERGALGIIRRQTPGGRLLRQFIPVMVGVPPLLGWLRLRGELAGIFGSQTGVGLMVGVMIVMGVSLLFLNAFSVDARERDRLGVAEAMKKLAYFDSLTGLPNRPLFYDRLHVAVAHATRHHRTMAVLYVDLDHFKTINDTLGHAVGDKVLVEVASRLQSSVRHSDTVARLGGDEFTAILTEVSSAEGVRVVAERIVRELARSFAVDGAFLHMSASVGIALSPADGHAPDELLRRADEALFRAKAKRNHYEFYSEAPARSA